MRYVVLTLAGTYRERAPARSPLSAAAGKSFRYDRFYLQVKQLIDSRRVTRILVAVESSFQVSAPGGLEAIRALLIELGDCGKEVWFFSVDYSDAELYLASACAKRVIHPLGSLRCVGLYRNAFFFRRLMERYGLDVQVVRRGKYKSAYDRFRLESMDPYNREQYAQWLNQSAARLHADIQLGHPEGALQELTAGRVVDPDTAVEEGWVHEVATRQDLTVRWKSDGAKPAAPGIPHHTGSGRTVAVLCLDGVVTRGKSSLSPVMGTTVGAGQFIQTVEKLRRSRNVAAVVLRINSGGGDAAASEDIRRAVERLAEKKPLIVSMGGVAGSGGYMIALPGRRVFAEHTTLTGSIGVLALSPVLGVALSRAGVTSSTVVTHPHADAMSGIRPLTKNELAELDSHVAYVYKSFVAAVARARDRSPDEIHALAEGRVWSGDDACERGLVDEIGGLDAAIRAARAEAGLARARVAFFPRDRRSFLQKQLTRFVATTSLGALLENTLQPDIRSSALHLAEFIGTPLLVLPEALDPLPRLNSGARNLF